MTHVTCQLGEQVFPHRWVRARRSVVGPELTIDLREGVVGAVSAVPAPSGWSGPNPIAPPSVRPTARGPLSRSLFAWWDGRSGGAEVEPAARTARHLRGADALTDDDVHLALWACYQMHRGGIDGVADEWEWDLATLAFRARLEAAFEAELRIEHADAGLPDDPARALEVLEAWSDLSLTHGIGSEIATTAIHRDELALHRSIHPRDAPAALIDGGGRVPVTAAVELDERLDRGDGERPDPGPFSSLDPGPSRPDLGRVDPTRVDPTRVDSGHSGVALIDGVALVHGAAPPDVGPSPIVDQLPGATLATDNLASLLRLHGRLRASLLGLSAAAPGGASVPLLGGPILGGPTLVAGIGRPSSAPLATRSEEAARPGFGATLGPLLVAWPHLGPDVVFGAAAGLRVERRFAAHLLRAWGAGRSSLRRDLAPTA